MQDNHEALTFHPLPTSAAGIGDLLSTAKGSGARFNAGKVPLDLIPLRLIGEQALRTLAVELRPYAHAMIQLGEFQETGKLQYLYAAVEYLGAPWEECAAVFDYGRGKYAPWNWAKGMPWSSIIASGARHLRALMRGELNDPESKLPHSGHVMCNLVMLLTYQNTYQEGNDLPTVFLAQNP